MADDPEPMAKERNYHYEKYYPFVNYPKLTVIEKLQLSVMTVFVLPVRAVLCLIFAVMSYLVCRMALIGLDYPTKPLMGIRHLFASMAFSSIGCHNLQFIGQRAKPAEAPILVLAPHCGFFDSYPHIWLGTPSYVGEKEFIDKTPFLGRIMKMSEPIAVNRNDKESKAKTVQLIKERAKQLRLEPDLNWPQLILFPEGTCTNLKSLIGFKAGAFNPGMPIQPVCIMWHMPYNHVSWCYDAPDIISLLWLTMCQLETRIVVKLLPVHTPTEEEKNNPDLFAENVRIKMSNAMQIPCSPFVYEDSKSISHTLKPRQDLFWKYFDASKLIRPGKGLRSLNAAWTTLNDSLYAKMSFLVTLDQFAEYTNVPDNNWQFKRLFHSLNWVFSHIEQRFRLLEMTFSIIQDSSNLIDLREFLIACFAEPSAEFLEFSFTIMAGQDGFVNDRDLVKLMRLPFLLSVNECYSLYDAICLPENKKGVSFESLCVALGQRNEFMYLFED